MSLQDTGVFLFRCERCSAAYIVLNREEMYGTRRVWDALEIDPCRACGKTCVEYVGILWMKGADVEPPG